MNADTKREILHCALNGGSEKCNFVRELAGEQVMSVVDKEAGL